MQYSPGGAFILVLPPYSKGLSTRANSLSNLLHNTSSISSIFPLKG